MKIPFNCIVFNQFEALDAIGPIEAISMLNKEYEPGYFSFDGGLVKSRQGFEIMTLPFSQVKADGIILVPGGAGVRPLVKDTFWLDALKQLVDASRFIQSVCTGSALLACTGLLDGRRATTNKMAFAWVVDQRSQVDWQKKARWVIDGNFYTSSGVTAGLDMELGFIADCHGRERAEKVAGMIEHIWNSDKNNDPFAR